MPFLRYEGDTDERPVIVIATSGPAIVGGQGDVEGCCHQCGKILTKGVAVGYLIDLILECETCGALNDPGFSNARHLHGKFAYAPMMFALGRYRLATQVPLNKGVIMASERATKDISIDRQGQSPSQDY